MTNDATRASAIALPETSRRRFLLNTTLAGAAIAVAAPVAAAEPDSELILLGHEFETAFAAEETARLIGRETGDWAAWDAAYAKTNSIVKRIEELPAQSLAELRVKARCIQWCYGDDPVFHDVDNETTDYRLARQIVVALLKGGAA